MSNEIQRPKLLIVEGSHEESFFNAALKDHLSIFDVQVLPIGSVLNKLRVHPDFVAPSPPCEGPPPPLAPPLQGGEKDRSLARSFDRAQQKHASRNRPSTVNTNLSRLQPLDFKTHYTGIPKSSKTRRKWLTI